MRLKLLAPDVLCIRQVEHKMPFQKPMATCGRETCVFSLHERCLPDVIENDPGEFQGNREYRYVRLRLACRDLVFLPVSSLSGRRCQQATRTEEEHCSHISAQDLCVFLGHNITHLFLCKLLTVVVH